MDEYVDSNVTVKGKVLFKNKWLNDHKYKPWLEFLDKEKGYCRACRRNLVIKHNSNHSLDAHARTSKHQRNMARYLSQQQLLGCSTQNTSEANVNISTSQSSALSHEALHPVVPPEKGFSGEHAKNTSPRHNFIAQEGSRPTETAQHETEMSMHDSYTSETPANSADQGGGIVVSNRPTSARTATSTCEQRNVIEPNQMTSAATYTPHQQAFKSVMLHQYTPAVNTCQSYEEAATPDQSSSAATPPPRQQTNEAIEPDPFMAAATYTNREQPVEPITSEHSTSDATSTPLQEASDARDSFQSNISLDNVIHYSVSPMRENTSFDSCNANFSLHPSTLKRVSADLAKYFLDKMFDNVKYCVLYEETSKKSIYKEMDIYIRFWNSGDNSVHMRYVASYFDAMNIHSNNMIEIFHEMLQSKDIVVLKKRSNELTLMSTNFVSSVQVAFELDERRYSWYWEPLNHLLSNLYNFIIESTKRTEHFLECSKKKLLPLPFSPSLPEKKFAAEMACKIWDDIKNFVQIEVQSSTSMFYSTVKEACSDILMPVRLQFFVYAAEMVQNFAETYEKQSPILRKSLSEFIVGCLKTFDRKPNGYENFDNFQMLLDSNATDNFVCDSDDNIYLGYVGEAMIKDLIDDDKVTRDQVRKLKTEVREFVFKMFRQLFGEYGSESPIVKSLPCLNPSYMISDKRDCIKRMRDLLGHFESANAKIVKYDEILSQYVDLLDDMHSETTTIVDDFQNANNISLETFFLKYTAKPKYIYLWRFIKMVLILFKSVADKDTNVSIEGETLLGNYNGLPTDCKIFYNAKRVIRDHIAYECKNNFVISGNMRQLASVAISESRKTPIAQYEEMPEGKRRKYM